MMAKKKLTKGQKQALKDFNLFDEEYMNEAVRDWLSREYPVSETDFHEAMDELQEIVMTCSIAELLKEGMIQIAGVNDDGELEFEQTEKGKTISESQAKLVH